MGTGVIPVSTTHTGTTTTTEENKVEATCKAVGSCDEVVKCDVRNAEISRETKTTDVDPENHVVAAGADWNTQTAEGHAVVCDCGVTLSEGEHTFDAAAGACIECGYGCDHKYGEHVKLCGRRTGNGNATCNHVVAHEAHDYTELSILTEAGYP